jgi:1,5-anhydro-D-fructose reductase (1,5-anhydro-D-mannitol-forming)
VRQGAGSIKLAALGFWHVHAPDYCAAAARNPETELAAVWDHDAERGRRAAATLGVPFVADLDAALGRADAVTVTTETSLHRDVMTAAAAAGVHVFSEKVLAPTVAEAEEIVAAADANDVRLTVSLPRLSLGSVQTVREVVESGSLGDISYGRVRLSHSGAAPGGERGAWLPERFFDPATAVGGALTDLGCHPAYLVQLFLGSRPETVSATYRSLTGRALEDHAVVTLGYANQRIGVVEAGFVSDDKFTIEVMGTDGWVSYRHVDGVVRAGGDAFGAAAEAPVTLSMRDDLPSPFDQWVGHILDGSRADDNLARAVELTRLVVAANEAAASGVAVEYG